MAFVAFAMSRPVSLVRDDYYEDSLREDQKREAEANARALGDRLAVMVTESGDLMLSFPAEQAGIAKGTATLYRASDPSADRDVPLQLAPDGTQKIPLRGLSPGHWLVKVRWSAGQRDFYVEQAATIR